MKALFILSLFIVLTIQMENVELSDTPGPCLFAQGFGDALVPKCKNCSDPLLTHCLADYNFYSDILHLIEGNFSIIFQLFYDLFDAYEFLFYSYYKCKVIEYIALIPVGIGWLVINMATAIFKLMSFYQCIVQDIDEADYYNAGKCAGQILYYIAYHKMPKIDELSE